VPTKSARSDFEGDEGDGITIPDPKKNPKAKRFAQSRILTRCNGSSGDGLDGVLALHGQQNAIIVFDFFSA